MIVIVACTALAISLSIIRLGCMFDDLYQRLLMRNAPAAREYAPDKFSFDPVKGFYVFMDKNPERTAFLKDMGLIPYYRSRAAR